ncbi:hypothetical protein MZD04_gp393 [Pseudomonas phage Psa21]|uniref:Uncharacterized protein n=1 Tax=Pseudomonas phage Psa21 TaxID=2530023 RepID=A0A481W4W8_9CAUD|nr:hypothetical protein MZD04_gp393 [Pseudomonas phage Psa21]QBJ02919.1 hypothetical protein PSA21_393 [Pseudomonas phage Psa21]
MSHLQKLVALYAEDKKLVPVAYYAVTGLLISGKIQSIDNGTALVAWEGETMRVKIQVSGLAGPSFPQEWCLTKEGLQKYAVLANEDCDALKQLRFTTICNLFNDVKNVSDDMTYHYVDKWPGVEAEDIMGFVSLNIHTVGSPLSGFLVNMEGRARFIHRVPENIKLRPM